MAAERNTGSRAIDWRRNMSGYLTTFGTTVTLVKHTQTTDSMSRVITDTETTSTIKADIQWITKDDLDHIHSGRAQVGDGMLFTEYDADIDIEDEVEFNSQRWRIDSQIEGEQISGGVVYNAYIIKRNKQS